MPEPSGLIPVGQAARLLMISQERIRQLVKQGYVPRSAAWRTAPRRWPRSPASGSDHWVLLGMFLIVLPAQYFLIWWEWYGLYTIFIPVYCFLVMPAVAAVLGDTDRFLERVSEQQWGVMLAVYCISHIPALATLEIPGFDDRRLLLIAFLIITTQGIDVLQYIFGKLFGRHLLSPRVSPSKTWEGVPAMR